MTKDCNHQWNKKDPRFWECTKCPHKMAIIYRDTMTQEEFAKLFPSLKRPVGKIILNELK
jgi:hypothetical protein